MEFLAEKKLIVKYPNLGLDRIKFYRIPDCDYLLGHEMSHLIYFWLAGKKERIIQPMMGYKDTKAITPMSYGDALVEGKVAIIQCFLRKADMVKKDRVDFLHCDYDRCIKGVNDFVISLSISGEKYNAAGSTSIDFTPQLEKFYKELEKIDLMQVWTELCEWVLSQTAPCS